MTIKKNEERKTDCLLISSINCTFCGFSMPDKEKAADRRFGMHWIDRYQRFNSRRTLSESKCLLLTADISREIVKQTAQLSVCENFRRVGDDQEEKMACQDLGNPCVVLEQPKISRWLGNDVVRIQDLALTWRGYRSLQNCGWIATRKAGFLRSNFDACWTFQDYCKSVNAILKNETWIGLMNLNNIWQLIFLNHLNHGHLEIKYSKNLDDDEDPGIKSWQNNITEKKWLVWILNFQLETGTANNTNIKERATETPMKKQQIQKTAILHYVANVQRIELNARFCLVLSRPMF